MHAALLVMLALTQAPSPPRWTLHVNSNAWCQGAPSGPCALRQVALDVREQSKVAMPPGTPWSCTAGETKAVGVRYLRTVTCTSDAGKTAVRATAVVENGTATNAELGLDWKDAKGHRQSVVVALDAAP